MCKVIVDIMPGISTQWHRQEVANNSVAFFQSDFENVINRFFLKFVMMPDGPRVANFLCGNIETIAVSSV